MRNMTISPKSMRWANGYDKVEKTKQRPTLSHDSLKRTEAVIVVLLIVITGKLFSQSIFLLLHEYAYISLFILLHAFMLVSRCPQY